MKETMFTRNAKFRNKQNKGKKNLLDVEEAFLMVSLFQTHSRSHRHCENEHTHKQTQQLCHKRLEYGDSPKNI